MDEASDSAIAAEMHLTRDQKRAFNKYKAMKIRLEKADETIQELSRQRNERDERDGLTRVARERMNVANTVSNFLNNVLFASSYEAQTYEGVKEEIEGCAKEMMDAFETAGINVQNKYYYKIIMDDMPSSYAEYFSFFGLMPGSIGTQASEGYNKVVKNYFSKRVGNRAAGMSGVVKYVMELSNVQLEHFFDTIAKSADHPRGQYRCSACGLLGHNKRSRMCPEFVYSIATSSADSNTQRRARLMARFKMRMRLAGRLQLDFEEGVSIVQVSVVYNESEESRVCLNTGSNHISFADLGDGVVHLTSMHLDRAYQNKGYGSLILQMLHRHWYSVGKFKQVIINNASSIGRKFYVKMGYEKNPMGDYVFNL